jgi:hypothetical protein
VANRVYAKYPFRRTPPIIIDDVKQVDITEITLFTDCRENEIYKQKEGSRGGLGHVFWSEAERRLFQNRFYESFMKQGKKIRMGLVKGYCKQLCDEFPAFQKSFSDPKIIKSVYYCVNNMSRKKNFLYPIKETFEKLYFRAYAVLDIVKRNEENMHLRNKLYYSVQKDRDCHV